MNTASGEHVSLWMCGCVCMSVGTYHPKQNDISQWVRRDVQDIYFFYVVA